MPAQRIIEAEARINETNEMKNGTPYKTTTQETRKLEPMTDEKIVKLGEELATQELPKRTYNFDTSPEPKK